METGSLIHTKFDDFYTKNYYLNMAEINDPQQEAELQRVRIQKAEEMVHEAEEMLTQNLDEGQKKIWEARLKNRQDNLERLRGTQEDIAA